MSVPLLCNYISLKFKNPNGKFAYFAYKVRFTPFINQAQNRAAILKQFEGQLGAIYLYDGLKLYLPAQLKDTKLIFMGSNSYKPDQTVHVQLLFDAEYPNDRGPEPNDFYNALMCKVYQKLEMDESTFCFFDLRSAFSLPQRRMEIWPGFLSSVHHVDFGLCLRLDPAFKVVSTITGLDILYSIRRSENADLEQQKFKEFCIGRIIFDKSTNTSFKVDDVDFKRTPLSTFKYQDQKISFVDYYKLQYNMTVKEMDQPLFISRKKLLNKIGGCKMALIPEFCKICPMREDGDRFQIAREICPYIRLPPERRVSAMETFIRQVLYNGAAIKSFSDWGLELDKDCSILKLPGRKIPSPSIIINPNCIIGDLGPDFSKEVKSNICFKPIPVKKYLILCTNIDAERARMFVRVYKHMASTIGISTFGEGEVISIPGKDPRDFISSLRAYPSLSQIQFLMVILPNHGTRNDTYAAVKRFCLTEMSIPSQLIQSKYLSNEMKVRDIILRIAIQINVKLGGAPWGLKFPLHERIMCIGMDVYHDPNGKNPSCAALIATLNNECTQCFSNCFFQTPKQEIMEGLSISFLKALRAYHEENKAYPQRILVYRDGVHSGQLEAVSKFEIPQFTTILDDIYGSEDSHPKFTFTIVQKRINERFFLKGPNGILDVPDSGTVVDSVITRPNYFDFFITSQKSIHSTIVPTRYFVLHDNSSIKPHLIQKFSYALSFMYYNYSGGIRVPAPCQYAHKLASLAGKILKSEPRLSMEKKLFFI